MNKRKKLLNSACVTAVACLALSGCANFSTTQQEVRYESGKPSNSITTKVRAYTLFSAKNALANFRATQTEKTQGASVGSLSQQGATNTLEVIDAMARLAAALRPTP